MDTAVNAINNLPAAVWTWGPGFFAGLLMVASLIAFLVVFSRLARAYLPAFLESQREQAQAMSRLATCVEGQRDNNKMNFERVILSLRVLHDDFKNMREELEALKAVIKKEAVDA